MIEWDPGDMASPVELVLVVRRPPGRGHVYRFARPEVTVGRSASCGLCLDGPGIEPTHVVFERRDAGYAVRAVAGVALNGRRLMPGEVRPIDTADALEVGDRIVEVAIDRDRAPTTDRQDAGRLRRAQEMEAQVRAAGGPSLWVLRGAATGAAVPLGPEGVRCGSAPDDGLLLSDASVEPGHFTVGAAADGTVWLAATAPVRLRGRTVREGRLVPGDLLFVGEAVCEVRGPRAVDAPSAGRWWPVALSGAIAVALLGVAWWLELR